jgi:hypothetical protein
VFWGSAAIAYLWGDFVHDGDKDVWSLPKAMKAKYGEQPIPRMGIYEVCGVGYPSLYAMTSGAIILAFYLFGWIIPISFVGFCGYGFFYV